MKPQTWIAPAKVNLTLHVTGKREDGFHELDSIVVFPNVGDALTFAPSDVFSLSAQGPFSKHVDLEKNSILDAVHWFEAQSGETVNMSISLEKNLPVAAGLGGGTADCAATIRALCSIYNFPLPEPSALVTLGADVPVCFYGQTCRMQGIGEVISPMRTSQHLAIVMINPMVGVSTGEIFGSPLLTRSRPSQSDFDREILKGHNDMERAAIALCPQIGERLEALGNTAPKIARMSGSGATCFGIYDDVNDARKAESVLRAAYPNDWIVATEITPSGVQRDQQAPS